MSKNNNKGIKSIIIGIAVTAILGITVLLIGSKIRKGIFENKNAATLYSHTIKSKIKILEIHHRSYHLILDNGQEYYFTIDKVYGILNYKDPLYNYVNSGDSIFKNEKSKTFNIKTQDKKFIEVSFYN